MEQQSASFESQLEAARCARVVYEALVGELYYLVLFQCFVDLGAPFLGLTVKLNHHLEIQ